MTDVYSSISTLSLTGSYRFNDKVKDDLKSRAPKALRPIHPHLKPLIQAALDAGAHGAPGPWALRMALLKAFFPQHMPLRPFMCGLHVWTCHSRGDLHQTQG